PGAVERGQQPRAVLEFRGAGRLRGMAAMALGAPRLGIFRRVDGGADPGADGGDVPDPAAGISALCADRVRGDVCAGRVRRSHAARRRRAPRARGGISRSFAAADAPCDQASARSGLARSDGDRGAAGRARRTDRSVPGVLRECGALLSQSGSPRHRAGRERVRIATSADSQRPGNHGPRPNCRDGEMLPARRRTAVAGGGSRALMGRRQALALVALALMIGAGLRFYQLGTAELSADEAASWAGATEPDLREVVARQRSLDPGKLALYDIALHGWIALEGDGVGSMRALSALLGTVAIALVFAATRELLLDLGGASEVRRAELGAALAALIAAVSFTLVDQARTVRMYPLTLVLELAQVVCFLRAASARARGPGRGASLAGVAVFGALATASNFTAVLFIAAEAMWLGWAAMRRRGSARASALGELHLLGPALALGAGMALLAPMAPMAGRTSIAVVHAGVLDWSHLRLPWWPLEMLRGASGKAPFLL